MAKNNNQAVNNAENVEREIKTKLSLQESQENVVSDIQKQMLQDEIEELPPLLENEASISGIYAFEEDNKIEVKIYIRNGFKSAIVLGKVGLVLANSKDEILAYQIFDLSEMGEIPSLAARPWKVYFNKENLRVDKFPTDDWKIAFDTNLNMGEVAKIKEYQNLPRHISDTEKEIMYSFLNGLGDVKYGEVSASTFNITMEKSGQILITLVFRNGTSNNAKFEKLPIKIVTPDNKILAQGMFKVDDLVVQPFKAMIYNLAFSTSFTLEDNMDLNECRILFE